MTLPTLVKNYHLVSNQNVTGDANLDAGGPSGACNSTRDRRALMLALKDQLIAAEVSNIGPGGFGAVTPWTVTQSCGGNNGGALAANASDNWVINTDLVFNTSGNGHAWTVLQQTGIAATFQVCIDLQQSSNAEDGAEIEVWVSQSAGFGSLAAGTTSARPTATDELMLVSPAVFDGWAGANTITARTWKWNMWRAEDGSVTYICYFLADVPLCLWVFAKPESPATGWSGTQFVAAVRSNGKTDSGNAMIYEVWYDATGLKTYRADRISTANPYNETNIYMTADTFGGGPFGQELTVANDVTGEYAIGKIGLASVEPGFIGRWGTMYDLYWGQTVLGNPFDTYPSGGTKTWVQFQDFILGWDGSTPVTT